MFAILAPWQPECGAESFILLIVGRTDMYMGVMRPLTRIKLGHTFLLSDVWYYTHILPEQSSIEREEDSFHQQSGPKFKEETSELLHLEHSIIWCWNMDTSGSKLHQKYQESLKRKRANWIGHILRRNYFLRHFFKRKTEGGIEVTEREGIRCKQLLDDVKEIRGYC